MSNPKETMWFLREIDRLSSENAALRAENASLRGYAELGRIAMRYIDRMSDPCEYVDPLEVIVRQYLAAMQPVIDRYHDAAPK